MSTSGTAQRLGASCLNRIQWENAISDVSPDIEDVNNANKRLESGHEPVNNYVQ